jgi:hypothetical protein
LIFVHLFASPWLSVQHGIRRRALSLAPSKRPVVPVIYLPAVTRTLPLVCLRHQEQDRRQTG